MVLSSTVNMDSFMQFYSKLFSIICMWNRIQRKNSVFKFSLAKKDITQ